MSTGAENHRSTLEPAGRALEPAGRPQGGDGERKRENGENPPMWWYHRSSSPTGPLPKKERIIVEGNSESSLKDKKYQRAKWKTAAATVNAIN